MVGRVAVGPVETEGPPVTDDGETLPDDTPRGREDPRAGAGHVETVDGRVTERDTEVVTGRPVAVTVHSRRRHPCCFRQSLLPRNLNGGGHDVNV